MDSVGLLYKREIGEFLQKGRICLKFAGVKSWCQLPQKLDVLYQIQQKLRITFWVGARRENI